VLLSLLFLTQLHNPSPFPSDLVLHIVPHTHLDPGWRQTSHDTYITTATPIYKQVLLELLLDPRRTFTMEPLFFFTKFLASTRSTPISTISTYSSPVEMYNAAVVEGLAFRASSLEPGLQRAAASGASLSASFSAPDASRLWTWKLVDPVHLSSIAAVLHDHEGKGDESRKNALTALLTETPELRAVALLFR
jgi:hypothetical protein